jgi:hypothetical protein
MMAKSKFGRAGDVFGDLHRVFPRDLGCEWMVVQLRL